MSKPILKPDATPISERDLFERYDEMLNEVYGLIAVCGLHYEAANILESVDPTAYRCGFADWLDSEIGQTLTDEIDGEYYDINDLEDEE